MQLCWLIPKALVKKKRRWKTIKATRVRKPQITLSFAGPAPPSAAMKVERAPLLLADFFFVYLPSELHPAPLGPCSNVFCYVSFQTEYLCVWSLAMFGEHMHTYVQTHSPSTFPLCQRSPFALPPTPNQTSQDSKRELQSGRRGYSFFPGTCHHLRDWLLSLLL